MNKKEYLELRNKLINEAQELLNNGDIDSCAKKREEIENLDSQFELEAKEKANLEALNKDDNKVIENKGETLMGAKSIDNIKPEVTDVAYEDVFAKFALGYDLTNEEKTLFNKYNPDFQNAYTHSVTNTEVLIPESVVGGIMKKAEESHPFLRDAKKYNIKGYVKFVKHSAIKAGDAKHYAEGTAVDDEQNSFAEVELKGFELAKAVTVTWKLQSMAISEFIPFLQTELGERIGAVMGDAAINGQGSTEPKGILKALSGVATQVIDYKKVADYIVITQAMAKLGSKYVNGAKIYANNSTIWNGLANIMDNNGRPLFIPDPTSGGVGRLFGLVVESEDAMKDNELLFGKADNYVININEPMKLVTEQHAKARTTDFVAYTIWDGACLDETAFVHVKTSARVA